MRRRRTTYLGDTSDHVVDRTSDSAQARNVLSATLPYRKTDDLLALDQFGLELDVHVRVAVVLLQGAAWTSYGDQARLDGDSDTIGDLELFGGEDVTHLNRWK